MRRITRLMAVPLFVTAILANSAAPQAPGAVQPGELVRVSLSTRGTVRREARWLGVRGDTVFLRDEVGTRSEWTLLFGDIVRLDPRRPLGGSYAPLGALIGSIGGAALTYALVSTQRCDGCDDPGLEKVVGAVLAIPAAAAGGVIGGFVGRSKRKAGWQRLTPPFPLALGRGARAMTFNARVTF